MEWPVEESLAELPLVDDILVFGKGSDEGPAGERVLSEAARERVEAVAGYLATHENFAGSVMFSCGWALNVGVAKPPLEQREANLMYDYAKSTGVVDDFSHVQFLRQAGSCTTIQDATFAARSVQLRFDRSQVQSLGVVAQSALPGRRYGHMDRCLLAARRAFDLPRSAVTPIPARPALKIVGETSEAIVYPLTRFMLTGAHGIESLERRDTLLRTIGSSAQQLARLRR